MLTAIKLKLSIEKPKRQINPILETFDKYTHGSGVIDNDTGT